MSKEDRVAEINSSMLDTISDARALGRVQDSVEPQVEAAHLLQGRRAMTILHAGERYRLRLTASNKLILTK